jgi:hypothetical protein
VLIGKNRYFVVCFLKIGQHLRNIRQCVKSGKEHVVKGIVFTEFMEMVEEQFGFTVLQQLIDSTNPSSGAVYTSVGTYPHQEIVAFVVKLSELSGIPVAALLEAFGEHLFSRLASSHPRLMGNAGSALDFLESIENHIHVEVIKLYPDAELPRFDITRISANQLNMVYRSSRSMAPLASGLIKGCAKFFNEKVEIQTTVLEETGTVVRFLISKSDR